MAEVFERILSKHKKLMILHAFLCDNALCMYMWALLGAEIGSYRLNRVLTDLDGMASLASPFPPSFNSRVQSLPVTRFPDNQPKDMLHEIMMEARKEQEAIQKQPYRTTPLIQPGAKPRPDLLNQKVVGVGKRKPASFRPLDERNVVANLNENQALVHRQFNSPKPLYSSQNVNEAVYVQTGVNLEPPIVRTPNAPKEFNPQNSPTFRYLIEEEGPGQLHQAPNVYKAPPQKQQQPHFTAPTAHAHLNSVGMPAMRIAQSETFNRLMHHVLGQDA